MSTEQKKVLYRGKRIDDDYNYVAIQITTQVFVGSPPVPVDNLCSTTVDELKPDRSLRVANHSPTGFEWGYAGSGPAQLALAILLDAFQRGGVKDAFGLLEGPKLIEQLALRFHQQFKQKFVQHWGPEWQITLEEIETWFNEVQ